MRYVNLDLPLNRVSSCGAKRLSCPEIVTPLRTEITNLLIERGFTKKPLPLEKLHLNVDKQFQEVTDDGINKVAQSLYETNLAFQEAYFQLMKYLASKLGFDFIFQTVPTFRFNFPGLIPDWLQTPQGPRNHHTDTMLGYPFEEINVWVPFSRSYGTNAMFLSSIQDGLDILKIFCEDLNLDADRYHNSRKLFVKKMKSDGDFSQKVGEICPPVEMEFGEILYFDPRCLHGANDNQEKHTRVSMDFRIIPTTLYEKMTQKYRSQGRSGRMFMKGDIFYEKSALEV